jgi:predicted TIM-barrel fold metal-dependent hydrolase
VFSGIGEFTIHKEFVSSKIAGEVASLQDPALDRIFDFAAEVGLVALIHNDIDKPFSKTQNDTSSSITEQQLGYLTQIKALFKRHPKTTIIWAHIGMGRVVRPVKGQAALIEDILKDPEFSHVYFDISWDQVAKYLVATPETAKVVADLINRYPDRFLFGTDEVAPTNQEQYLKIYSLYDPLWKLLTPEASEKVRKGNYERLFDEARSKVRAWEKAQGLSAAGNPQ